VSADELKHHYRVVDMMLSMHSLLRDRYRRDGLIADLLLLFFSLVLNAFVFLDPSILDALRIGHDASRIVIGVSSILLLFLSLVIWRVDWKERAQAHAQATDTLAKLKLDCRTVLKASPVSADLAREQAHTCTLILTTLPKIPERDFIRLKAAHKRKVQLSRLLDAYSGTPVWVLRLRMMWRDTRAYFRDKQIQPPGNRDV